MPLRETIRRSADPAPSEYPLFVGQLISNDLSIFGQRIAVIKTVHVADVILF